MKKILKERKKTRRHFKSWTVILTCAIFALLLLLCWKSFFDRDYYSIESRLQNMKNTKITNGSDFQAIGWLRVQGTSLDMPIVWSPSSSADYPVELKNFAWSLGHDDHFHNKINIMGHNIFNLSSQPKKSSELYERFEELMSFVYYDFAKENKYIQLTLDGEEYVYKIYSVGFINASEVIVFPNHDDYTEDELDYQLKLYDDVNLYQYDVDVNKDDSFISLITCTRFFGQDRSVDFIVNGRLLRDGEKIDDFKVTKSDNYEKIEKILKGVDYNEDDDSL